MKAIFKNRLFVAFIALLQVCINVTFAQTNNNVLKFDFGLGKAQKGFTKVIASDTFSYSKGFGFETNNRTLEDIGRKEKNAAIDGFVTSNKPFQFSVKLPEGNYDVKMIIGDVKDVSAATIRAECRRLMVEPLITEKGKTVELQFTVHIRDTIIKANGKIVRIKSRERNYLHWDDKLTIELNGASPKLCAMEITPNTDAITVFLAGNSTVVDQAEEPYAAWGQMFPAFFEPKKVVVANYAESGETASGFMSARRLEKILTQMKKGDYLFIEFAHNDQKQKGEGVGAFTTYKRDISFYVNEARKKGGNPVLVTSMNRRNFDSSGKVVMTLGDYPAAMRLVAKELHVPLIDLNEMSKTLYEAWGKKESEKAFVIYPANSFPNQPKAFNDNTHFNPYGAYEIARCIVQGMKDIQLPLAEYLKKTVTPFNPAKPDAINQFNWPLSITVSVAKPDGN